MVLQKETELRKKIEHLLWGSTKQTCCPTCCSEVALWMVVLSVVGSTTVV